MNRISVSPEEVRGLGDIVSPKSVEDFRCYRSSLELNESVYSLIYDSQAVRVTLTANSTSFEFGSECVLTATVTEGSVPVSGESVEFWIDGRVWDTVQTDNSGVAVYRTSGMQVGTHPVIAKYGSYSSQTVNIVVDKITTSITLSASQSPIGWDVPLVLSGVLTGMASSDRATVRIYNGSTLVTSTQTNNGAFEVSLSNLNIGNYTFKAVYDGAEVYANCESSTVAVTVTKPTPTITLSVDKTSAAAFETVAFTGSLSIGSGKTVEIQIQNGRVLGTVTTGANGAFQWSTSQLDSGQNVIRAVFNGDDSYNQCTSDYVYVNISKITPTITITSPSSGYVGVPFTITGTINNPECTSVDISGMDGRPYWVEKDVPVQNGVFSLTHTFTNASTNTCTVTVNLTAHYDWAFKDFEIIIRNQQTYNSIVPSSDKQILSKADNDKATLYAQLMNGQSTDTTSGVTITFHRVDQNGTIIETIGTAQTDNNGKATLTNGYTSQGIGDIYIKATDGSLLSETYELQDYWQILPSITPKGFITEQCPYPAEITGQVAKNGAWGGTRIRGYNNNQQVILYCFLSNNSGNAGEGEKIRYNVSSSYQDFKIVLKEDTATLYINDNLISSVNASATDGVAMDGGSNSNPVSLTNIKLKRL